jgi:glyoxylase-like metal-dependent hydrolase (beta-lactamase superfamily II)
MNTQPERTSSDARHRTLRGVWVGLIAIIASTLGILAPGLAQQTVSEVPAGILRDGPAFTFDQISDGIYHARGTGEVSVGSNGVVIINENDVILVDSHISPAAAWVMMEDLKSITDKPVRYVINTHFHFDHAHGNQIYGPDIDVIGHDYTRQRLSDPEGIIEGRTYQNFAAGVPAQVENLREQVRNAEGTERQGPLERQLRIQENYAASLAELRPTPPTISLESSLTLDRGGREIQILFLGRGHTGGDIVVYLPEERIVATGDLMVPSVAFSWMGDAFLDEWPDTLEALKALDFDTVLPGHGQPFSDPQIITNMQAYQRDLWSKISTMREQGLSIAQIAEQVDMTNHRGNFQTINGPGTQIGNVERAFERMDEIAGR